MPARPGSPRRRCSANTASSAWCWTAGRRSTRCHGRSTSTTRSTACWPGWASPSSSPRSPGPAAGFGCSTRPAGTRRVPPRHRDRPARLPEANMFDQPELEACYGPTSRSVGHRPRQRGGHRRHPGRPSRVRVEFTDRVTGRDDILADYVLGCDGANSLIRAPSAPTMQGLPSRRAGSWSTSTPTPTSASGRAYTSCATPTAPAPTCGWRDPLPLGIPAAPGETAPTTTTLGPVEPLICPGRRRPRRRFQLVRVTAYTFRAHLANRWRDRHVFLLGDAAHLTPPFVGQGLGAGCGTR